MSKITAGYGESIITPPLGVELCGYGFYLERRAESVSDDLKARAVCVSADKKTLFLIACDLIGFDAETSDRIRGAIASEHHIPQENVLLACTHTHSGPATASLHGCGEMAPEYVRQLPELIVEAARRAARDRTPCEVTNGSEQSEPIGYNRRFKIFQPIDPTISAVIFERENFPICIFSYACHAVTLGPNTAVSADWPGAAARAMEREGYHCVCFQGFCGDIDPVCNLNKWGGGTPEDLALYGNILKYHLLNITNNNRPEKSPVLAAAERRISLPLAVPPDKGALGKEYRELRSEKNDRSWEKFADEWRRSTETVLDRFHAHPYLDNVPVQAMRLGKMNLLALPGEIFCEYGLKLRSQFPPFMAIGYANGNTGYWPVKTAFDNAGDYAACLAPKIYGTFPFTSAIEDIISNVCWEILTGKMDNPPLVPG